MTSPNPPQSSFDTILDILEAEDLDALILEEGVAVKTLVTTNTETSWICVIEVASLDEETSAVAAFSRIPLEIKEIEATLLPLLTFINAANQHALILGALEFDPEDHTLICRTGLLFDPASPPATSTLRHTLIYNWAEFERLLPPIATLIENPSTADPAALLKRSLES